jgi:hypothetical protein
LETQDRALVVAYARRVYPGAKILERDFAGLILLRGPLPYLETSANLLELLERLFRLFSKHALKSLNNQTDFDSAIRRFDPSRPSQDLKR